MTAASAAPAPEGLRDGASPAAWWVLAVLIAVGLYMFADRHVVVLQAEPIRHALGLSDLQIGLVQGLAVAIFAAVAGYPIAWLADRFDVRFILAGSVLLWAAAVAACGLAGDFEQLFLASMLVGAGEAGLLPITYALIPQLFRGRARLLANAMVTLVGRVASGGVIILAGLLVAHVGAWRGWFPAGWQALADWRLALIALALPGPVFALLVLSLRVRAPVTVVNPAATGGERVGGYLRAQAGTLVPFYLGVGLLVFGMSAIGAFLPVVAIRQMGGTPAGVGAGIGSATLVSTLLAIVFVVGLTGPLSRRLGPGFVVWLLVAAALGPALLTPGFLFVRTTTALYLLLGLSFLFLSSGAMAFPTVLQELTPQPLRGRLISISILTNIILSALAPAAVGALSDRLRGLPNGLVVAMVIVATAALTASALLTALTTRGYARTAAAARAQETPA